MRYANPDHDPILNPSRIEVIDEASAAILRALGPAGRLAMLDQMVTAGRELMITRIRAEHPDWNDVRVRDELLRRLRLAHH